MMNSKLFLIALSSLALLSPPVSWADTVADTPDATVHHSLSKVGTSLASLPIFNGIKPSTSARYYIYLCSAGWCGPCCRELPALVEAYKEMKESGVVEMVMVDFDRSPEDAAAFVKRYGVNFPASMSDNGVLLPGYVSPKGIPHAMIVNAAGEVLVSAHADVIFQWKKVISAYEKEHALPLSFPEEILTLFPEEDGMTLAEAREKMDAAGDEDSGSKAKSGKATRGGSVAAAMRKIKWFNGKPSKKAEYYIYLQSASWCGPCCAEMPEIAKEYLAMKKDGRVELVLLGCDRSVGDAKAFLKDYKAKFPGTMQNGKGVAELPGFRPSNGVPNAIIVDAEGNVLANDHGSIVRQWRKYTIEAADSAAAAEDAPAEE